MRPRGAAVGGSLAARPPNSGLISISRRGLSLADSLPCVIYDRLARNGVNSMADWLALGPRRLQIFGITARVAAMIDALAVPK
jgi:hypothetical protein